MTLSPDEIRARREEEIQPLIEAIAYLLTESDGESEVRIDISELISSLEQQGFEPDEEPFNLYYYRELDSKVFLAIKRVFERSNWKVGYRFECERDDDGDVVYDRDGDPCVEQHILLFLPADVWERHQRITENLRGRRNR
jgi:hypothetical protein